MLFTWEWFILDPQCPKLLTSFLTQVQSISPSPVVFVMMRLQVNIGSRSSIQIHNHSLKEIKNQRDARLWLMICKSLSLKRFCLRLHQSWLMDLLNYRVSFGKITPVFNHLMRKLVAELTWSYSSLKINALSSNSLPFINLKD